LINIAQMINNALNYKTDLFICPLASNP